MDFYYLHVLGIETLEFRAPFFYGDCNPLIGYTYLMIETRFSVDLSI